MDFELADFAVHYALKNGASYADVRLESTTSNQFLLINGSLKAAGFDLSSGIGIRVIVNKTAGFFSTNQLEREKITSLLDHALALTSRASKLHSNIQFASEKPIVDEYEVKTKQSFEDTPSSERIALLQDVEKATQDTHINVPGRYFSLSDDTTQKYFVNSEGTKITSRIPRWNTFFVLTVKDAQLSSQRILQFGGTGGFENIQQHNLPELVAQEVRTAQRTLTAAPAPQGKKDVVLAPELVGIATHESIGHPHEADRIFGREAAQAGESYLSPDLFGKRIGSDVVNISDDPTLDSSFGFYLYDDEGVKARKRTLVTKGFNNELLHNRESAGAQQLHSNGSSRAAGWGFEPVIRMGNTFVEPGEYKEEELIEGVQDGIYIKSYQEWNIDDKRVNQKYTAFEAYEIINGRLGQLVKRPALEISTPALWSAVDAVADNMEHFAGNCGKAQPMQGMPVWFGGPSVRLRNISFK